MATTHVHASCRRFISRTGGWRSALTPVGTRFVFTNLAPKALAGFKSGAVWFLVWWLYLHRRLRLRQRGSLVRRPRATSATFEVDHFPESASTFLSTLAPIVKSCDSSVGSPSLSASARGVIATTAACRHSQTMRHRISLPFLSLVTTPVSIATRMWVIRSPPLQVKQKIL